MSIEFLNGGFLTTLQDWGREGFQEFGVPVSGVMDRQAMVLGNVLVGNEDREAVLEVTLMGPMMIFKADQIIAITGGDLMPRLDNQPLPMYQAVLVKAGQKLTFGGVKSGCRAYIAVAGGFNVPEVMGSKSTNLKAGLGGYKGRKLNKGDVLEFNKPKVCIPNMELRHITPTDYTQKEIVLRVILGPQEDAFTQKGIETFLSKTYAVTNESDRMGYRLDGEKIEHKDGGDIITDGIAFGAVQVPSHGQPIIMLADRQTTGGYTKIANVISVDLPKIAQCMPGHKIRFEAIEVEKAQALYVERIKENKALREAFEKEQPQPSEEAVILPIMLTPPDGRTYKITINGKTHMVSVRKEN